jgi:hypothetical protein
MHPMKPVNTSALSLAIYGVMNNEYPTVHEAAMHFNIDYSLLRRKISVLKPFLDENSDSRSIRVLLGQIKIKKNEN